MDQPDISTYIEESEIIERMYMDLLEGTTQKRMKRVDDGSTGLQNVEYRICVINSKNKPLQIALLQRYEEWYEGCRVLFNEYTKGRNLKSEEFAELHERILILIGLKDPVSNSNEKRDLKKEFRACFDAMVIMLRSIGSLIISANNNHEIMNEIGQMNSELEEAESLYEKGSVRSACITAGNALERYLRMLGEMNGIEPESGETIDSIVQNLLETNKAKELDQEMLETMEYLVNLSKRCTIADEDEESLEGDVRELIDRVREIVFLALF